MNNEETPADIARRVLDLARAYLALEERVVQAEQYEARAVGAMQQVAALFDRYQWMQDGRGPYAYDDAGYDADVRAFMGELAPMLPSARWYGREGALADLAKLDALEADNAALLDALSAAIDVAQWMSGSDAFGPDGIAHEGWVDVMRPKLFAAMEARTLAELEANSEQR